MANYTLQQNGNNADGTPRMQYMSNQAVEKNTAAQTAASGNQTVGAGNNNQSSAYNGGNVKTYTAAQMAPLDPNDSVEARVQRIIDRSGPALESEVTRAKQNQNSKGLLNTSMAIGENERARYDYSLPIGQQDANNQLSLLTTNLNATNDARRFSADAANALQRQQLAGEQNLDAIDRTGSTTIDSLAFSAGVQQKRDAALQRYGITNKEIDAMTEAQRDDRLNEFQVQRDQRLQEYGLTNQEVLALTDEEKDYRLDGFQADRDERLQAYGVTNAELAAMTQEERDTRLNGFQTERDGRLQEYGITTAEIAAMTQEERDFRLNAFDVQKDERANTQAYLMENLSAENKKQVVQIQGEYQLLLQNSAAAATVFASYSDQVSAILANPKIKDVNKQALINKQLEIMNANLDMQDGIVNTDFSTLLNFGSTEIVA